jgi:hypothetical protein
VVQGDAVIVGLTIPERMYISTGTWNRSPRFFEVENEISHFGVTESTNGNAYIACNCRPMSTWLKGKLRFGRAVGWSKEVLDLLEERFTEWLEHPIPTII